MLEIIVVALVCSWLFVIIFRALALEESFALDLTTFISVILVLPFVFSLGIRRLHDLGRSGWLMLLNFIPIIGSLFSIYLLVGSEDFNSNLYGNVPPAKWDLRVLLPS